VPTSTVLGGKESLFHTKTGERRERTNRVRNCAWVLRRTLTLEGRGEGGKNAISYLRGPI